MGEGDAPMKWKSDRWNAAQVPIQKKALTWLQKTFEYQDLPSSLSLDDFENLRAWRHCFENSDLCRGYEFHKFWSLDQRHDELLFHEPYQGEAFENAIQSRDFSIEDRLRWGQQAFEVYELLNQIEPSVSPCWHRLMIVDGCFFLVPNLESLLGMRRRKRRKGGLLKPPSGPYDCPFLLAAVSVICLGLSYGSWNGESPRFEELVGEPLNAFLQECYQLHRGGFDWLNLSCRYLVLSEHVVRVNGCA